MNNTYDNTKELNLPFIEFLHDQQLLPDRYYYQLNGKSAIENYNDQHNKFLDKINDNNDTAPKVNFISEVLIK